MKLPRYTGRFVQAIVSALLTLLAATILCITLVRFAPGFESDIRELDPRLNAESVRSLQAQRASGTLWETVRGLGARALAGDLGDSRVFQRPVLDIVTGRSRVTAIPLFAGIAAGWFLAIGICLLNRICGSSLRNVSRGASSWLLCLPAPVLALALITRSASPELAPVWVGCVVAFLVFPRVLLTADRVLSDAAYSPHVAFALARGLSRGRVLFAHVIWPAAPALLAIAGSSVGIALGGVMPVEVVCDSPGLGQLAWLATQQRDLPVLLAVTFLVTLTALAASLVGDMVRPSSSFGSQAA